MRFRVTVDGRSYDVEVEPIDDAGVVSENERHDVVACPIAGTVLEVLVAAGDSVVMGQPLLVIEALKVESNVASPHDGVVSAVLVSEGQRVSAGEALLRF